MKMQTQIKYLIFTQGNEKCTNDRALFCFLFKKCSTNKVSNNL